MADSPDPAYSAEPREVDPAEPLYITTGKYAGKVISFADDPDSRAAALADGWGHELGIPAGESWPVFEGDEPPQSMLDWEDSIAAQGVPKPVEPPPETPPA